MDAVSDPDINQIVVLKASQVGWTEILNNITGFHIDQDPAPLLLIQPTLEMGQAWSKDRLAPMLRDTPCLTGKVKDARMRDSGNTLLHKTFPGGHLTIVGANSAASLAMRPIRVVLADEVDRYPASAGKEGDPLKLAAKRQTTFWNRKTLLGSTPTLKVLSVIWREWLKSDQRRFFVPCPDCGHMQYLKWAQVTWDKETTESGSSRNHKPQTAHYACEDCGTLWTDIQRWNAITKGEWRVTNPDSLVAGFHVPGFLSPWLSLEQIVREFLEALDHPELLQVWTNTVLGEPWEETGKRLESTGLLTRLEAYDDQSIPEQVLYLTAGVDVQDDRLEVQVIGWGANEESWVIWYEIINGDPAQPQVWKDLDAVLTSSFTTETGRVMRVRATCIDSGGHHSATVLTFCQQRKLRRVFATKGMPGPKPIWPMRASRTKTNHAVHMIGVDSAKEALYGRLSKIELRHDDDGDPLPTPGYVHFPAMEGIDQTYFDQLTSEQVVTRYREGRPYRVWVLRDKGARNEVLDTWVLAMAARGSLSRRADSAVAFDTHQDEEPDEAQEAVQIPPPGSGKVSIPGGGKRRLSFGSFGASSSRRDPYL